MTEATRCEHCQKPITGKPFIPVNSFSTYHWKCYITKIREEKEYSETIEENVEEVVKEVVEEKIEV